MNDLSASSRITWRCARAAAVVRRIRGLSDKARMAVHHPDDRAAAGDQHLPAGLDDLSVVHQLSRQPGQCPGEWLGIDWYQTILTDPDIWAAMQVTAHFVIWTVVIETVVGVRSCLPDRQEIPWPRHVDHDHPAADDAFAGRGRQFLDVSHQPQIGLFNYVVAFLTGRSASSFQMLGDVTLSPWAIVIVDAWMWTPYVMLILAGLRSIPDYIYEAAEVDRASKWRQFWSITLPMALPFIMLAVLFRGIENFKMFDMVNLLTGGGPGSTTEVASITLKRAAFESWRTGYSSAFDHFVRDGVWPGQHLCQGAEPGEEPMSIANSPFRRRTIAQYQAIGGFARGSLRRDHHDR